jgi:CRP-like cAMP-binding protein
MGSGIAPADFARRLAQTRLFRGLDDAPLAAIARYARLRSLRSAQVLWKQGSHAYELAFVWEGQLDVVRRTAKRVSFRAVKQNEIIGVSNAMGLTPCTVDVVAACASRVLLIPGELLRSLVPKHPEIAFRALDYMGVLLGRMSDELELLHHSSLEDRVVHRLRTLADGNVEIAITHEELAQNVGARRDRVGHAPALWRLILTSRTTATR